MKVHEALLEVMRAIPAVKKEDRNTQQNFNFRGIDAVLNAVGPAMRKHGVIALPQLMEQRTENFTTAKGTAMRLVVLTVRYTFVGPEGDALITEVPGEAADAGDKAYSKAMSVAFRTALLQTLALPTDERDPDADAHERVAEKPTVTAVDVARTALLAKVKKLKLNPGDVAQLYFGENGVSISEETNEKKILSFMERLEPNK